MDTIVKPTPVAEALFTASGCVALVAAAGSSTRMAGVDKLFVTLGDKPVLAHTLLAYQGCAAIDGIVISAREDRIPDVQRLCDEYEITKLRAIVPGGATRAASVRRAVAQADESARYFAIADGDRPFTTAALIEDTLEAAMRCGGAVCALPVHDTIKQTDAQGRIVATPDRATLWAAQTPQIFPADAYREALVHSGDAFTDDSAMMEAAGVSVRVVPGLEENIKITTPTDLLLAQALWKEREL